MFKSYLRRGVVDTGGLVEVVEGENLFTADKIKIRNWLHVSINGGLLLFTFTCQLQGCEHVLIQGSIERQWKTVYKNIFNVQSNGIIS